jgi:Flp pilus assembly protein protease CpaA
MDETPPEEALPPSLRFLKWLVVALTLTMIGGVITVVAVLVTRMPETFGSSPAWPADLALPEGAVPEAVTQGRGWTAVVTTDQRILIFNPDGSLRQVVAIRPAP